MFKLIEKRNQVLDEAEGIVKAALEREESMTEAEAKRHGELMAESDKLTATIEAERVTAQKRTEISAATRPAIMTNPDNKGEDAARAEHRNQFLAHLRGEVPKAALTLTAKKDVLIPTTLYERIIEGLKPYGGVRAARVTVHSNLVGTVNIPVANDTVRGRRTSTGAAVTVDPTSLASVPLTPYEYTSDTIVIDRSLLDGSPLAVEQLLAGMLSDRIWRITNQENTTGNGTGMPNGLLAAAPLGFTGATAATFLWEELVEVEHSVPPQFRANAEWMMNDKTLKFAKKIKNSMGEPIFLDGNIQHGTPATLLGYTVVINDDLPDMGAGAKPILFGDFSRYHVCDGLNWSIRVLNELYAANNQVGFLLFSMHGGTLADAAGAIKYFQHSAT